MSPADLRHLALQAEPSSGASEHWRALLSGDWVLVDQFDRDGRRYLIAEHRPEPDAIARADWELLRARAQGASLKMIAAEFGLSESAVCRRSKRAMQKLGLRSQLELARLFAEAVLAVV